MLAEQHHVYFSPIHVVVLGICIYLSYRYEYFAPIRLPPPLTPPSPLKCIRSIYNSWPRLAPTLYKHYMYIGVGVGWQRRWIACQSLRGLDNQGTVFLFFGGHHDGYRVRSCCAGWRTLTPHSGNGRIT